MVHQAVRFTDSFIAWESWNLTEYEHRKQLVCEFKKNLSSTSGELESVIDYHINQSEALVATRVMPGPTGEINELYMAGRGVTLIIHDDDSVESCNAVLAMLTTALLAGNSVMLCSDNRDITSMINKATNKARLPADVVLTGTYDSHHTLLSEDIRCVCFVGDREPELQINRNLAKKKGAIVSFISETDFLSFDTILDPYLYLRFITERTRTINITAIGGNASLLELGSDGH
ncbi:1-pyrroline-5-carboxylate dehydrogenase [Vibrio salinus]|uniref:1-pyrroline-5-carboxylate dehydrogenase n=1 Tax=Vibrio salinus TaxID=2899784 RepID=UPI001E31D87E|nr:1-pyrroline-5-carboxylate dehydrogenase [Vibrio salinus]MCE0495118.1 1-pyrroline-5-carboxylate dehydrogenase [Vibrio salinus]